MITKAQYEDYKKRIAKGEEVLEGHWDDPAWAKHVQGYSELMEAVLEYEITQERTPVPPPQQAFTDDDADWINENLNEGD